MEIKYSELETIEIVKSLFKGIEDKQIKKFIRKYGCKPRYILGDIEEGMVNLKTTPPKIKAIDQDCKSEKSDAVNYFPALRQPLKLQK